MTRLCVIGGTGRSGTTVLRRVLGSHPHVATAPTELRFLTDPDGILDFWSGMMERWSPYDFDVRIRRLERLLRSVARPSPVNRATKSIAGATRLRRRPDGTRSFSAGAPSTDSANPLRTAARHISVRSAYSGLALDDWYRGFAGHSETLIDELTDFVYEGRWIGTPAWSPSNVRFGETSDAMTEALQRYLAEVWTLIAGTRSHFVEDSPLTLLSFHLLHRLDPSARLVHIRRDPRDVVASMQRVRWAPSSAEEAARFVRAILDRWQLLQSGLDPASLVQIRLEDLVGDTRATLELVLDHLALTWSDDLLSVDLSGANIGRWQSDIARRDQAAVFRILEPHLSEYSA